MILKKCLKENNINVLDFYNRGGGDWSVERLYAKLNGDLDEHYRYGVNSSITEEKMNELVESIKKEFSVPSENVYLTFVYEGAVCSSEVAKEGEQGVVCEVEFCESNTPPKDASVENDSGRDVGEEDENEDEDGAVYVDENSNFYTKNVSPRLIIVRQDVLVLLYADTANIYYNTRDKWSKEKAEKLKLMFRDVYKPSLSKPRIGLIGRDCQGGLQMQYFSAKKCEVDLAVNYNDDFMDAHERILSFCKDKEASGLVLLRGKFGTGKTMYMRHLFWLLARSQDIIYLPNELIHVIADPSFVGFMRAHSKSIVILEDAESVLRKRLEDGTDKRGVANILNLTDGILGDCLMLKIIATFNCEIGEIDEALLRKGRLICDYEFKPLATEKAKELFKKLGKENEFKGVHEEGYTLADIYNHGVKNRFNIEDKVGKFGFRA